MLVFHTSNLFSGVSYHQQLVYYDLWFLLLVMQMYTLMATNLEIDVKIYRKAALP